MESLRLSNAKEVDALQEQSKRLQVQLNNGYTSFAEFKAKKGEEINILEAQLKNAKASNLAAQTTDQSTPKVTSFCYDGLRHI